MLLSEVIASDFGEYGCTAYYDGYATAIAALPVEFSELSKYLPLSFLVLRHGNTIHTELSKYSFSLRILHSHESLYFERTYDLKRRDYTFNSQHNPPPL